MPIFIVFNWSNEQRESIDTVPYTWVLNLKSRSKDNFELSHEGKALRLGALTAKLIGSTNPGDGFDGRVTLSCPLSCIILWNHTD